MRSFILRWCVTGEQFPHTAACFGERGSQDARRRRDELAQDEHVYALQLDEAAPREGMQEGTDRHWEPRNTHPGHPRTVQTSESEPGHRKELP